MYRSPRQRPLLLPLPPGRAPVSRRVAELHQTCRLLSGRGAALLLLRLLHLRPRSRRCPTSATSRRKSGRSSWPSWSGRRRRKRRSSPCSSKGSPLLSYPLRAAERAGVAVSTPAPAVFRGLGARFCRGPSCRGEGDADGGVEVRPLGCGICSMSPVPCPLPPPPPSSLGAGGGGWHRAETGARYPTWPHRCCCSNPACARKRV